MAERTPETAKTHNGAMEFVRAVVRPILTVGSVGAAIAMVFLGIPLPQWLETMIGMMVAWWFADRTRGKST